MSWHIVCLVTKHRDSVRPAKNTKFNHGEGYATMFTSLRSIHWRQLINLQPSNHLDSADTRMNAFEKTSPRLRKAVTGSVTTEIKRCHGLRQLPLWRIDNLQIRQQKPDGHDRKPKTKIGHCNPKSLKHQETKYPD